MSDSDRIDPPAADSGEAGNFVTPVDLGTGKKVGTDPASDRGDFTTSTDLGEGDSPRPNVERGDGEYTASESNRVDPVGEGEYTDRDK